MNTNTFLAVLATSLLLTCSINFAQINDTAIYHHDIQKNRIKDYSSNYFIDGLILTSVIGGSFFLDGTMRTNIKQENYNDLFMKIGHNYGDVYYSFYFAGAMYASHYIWKNNNVARTGKTLLESLAIASLASISFKYIFGRSRPYVEKGNTNFNWFETKNRKNSFPSGHVITAFTTSTVLSKSINNTYATFFLYGLAGLTAYQRISSDNHWFSDTVMGATIGILVGEYFSKINKKNDSNNYLLIPFYSNRSIGVSANFILGN